MFTDVKKEQCASHAHVCVLLGGSGRRPVRPQKASGIAALLKPRPCEPVPADQASPSGRVPVEA